MVARVECLDDGVLDSFVGWGWMIVMTNVGSRWFMFDGWSVGWSVDDGVLLLCDILLGKERDASSVECEPVLTRRHFRQTRRPDCVLGGKFQFRTMGTGDATGTTFFDTSCTGTYAPLVLVWVQTKK
jgi:hypothetical protein